MNNVEKKFACFFGGRNGEKSKIDGSSIAYYAATTKRHAFERLSIAHNYVEISGESLDTNAPEGTIVTYKARIYNSAATGLGAQKSDDAKNIVLIGIDSFLPMGMKFYFLDNWWIVDNPDNYTSLFSNGVIRRCHNTLNVMDEWGRVRKEPFFYKSYYNYGTTDIVRPEIALMDSDNVITIQANSWTKTIKNGDRFIVGGQAWSVKGLNRAIRMKTDDPDSVGLITFSLAKTEEKHELDDLQNDVVNGFAPIWKIKPASNSISGCVGTTGKLNVWAEREGVREYHELVYEAADKSVISIDNQGNFWLEKEGETVVKCVLANNENVSALIHIRVTAEPSVEVRFDAIPSIIKQYSVEQISACLYKNGHRTDTPIKYKFSGAANNYYKVKSNNDNTIEIECLFPCVDKLVVEAVAEDQSAVAEIWLRAGW